LILSFLLKEKAIKKFLSHQKIYKNTGAKQSFAPVCRVLTEKMQEQSLVPQGFAGF